MDERERYEAQREAQREFATRLARAGGRYADAIGRIVGAQLYRGPRRERDQPAPPKGGSNDADVADVEVVVRGPVSDGVVDYARAKIVGLVEHLGESVLHARIRLTHEPDPAVSRPVRAQVNLELDGRMVRAQVAGATGREAVDLLIARLRHRLVRFKQHWEARRGGQPMPGPHEWRHGSEPTHRPPYYPRPLEERQLVRHKSFSPARISPQEAAWEMDRMDYDFHLFTETATGSDAVVYRGGQTGYRLARVASGSPSLEVSDVPLTLTPHPAPELSVDQARQRLDELGWPFVFFTDPETRRGQVLYHRYDGHYGLITPTR
jgi:ribosome-associated translation inhibitor RaiA